jgi:hypothetical protein
MLEPLEAGIITKSNILEVFAVVPTTSRQSTSRPSRLRSLSQSTWIQGCRDPSIMLSWSSRGHGPEGEKKSSSANFTLFINTIIFPSENTHGK